MMSMTNSINIGQSILIDCHSSDHSYFVFTNDAMYDEYTKTFRHGMNEGVCSNSA